jgi:hypothetical protein
MGNHWLEKDERQQKLEEQKRIYEALIVFEDGVLSDPSFVVAGSPDATHYNFYTFAKQFFLTEMDNEPNWQKICEAIDYIAAKYILTHLGTFEEH